MGAVGRRTVLQSVGLAALAGWSLPPFVRTVAAQIHVNPDLFAQSHVFTGVELDLPSDLLRASRPTVIWCDTLRLSGAYPSPGASLLVVAREIYAVPEATIDTSGRAGVPDHPVNARAADGPHPGDNGSDGAPGGKGGDAGVIIIIASAVHGRVSLLANGGPGGRGQSGGWGAVGRVGPAASRPCTIGGTGHRGGVGGLAGGGGAGGRPGIISVMLEVAPQHDQIMARSEAGTPGEPGVHGNPGEGGRGGVGGPAVPPDPDWLPCGRFAPC